MEARHPETVEKVEQFAEAIASIEGVECDPADDLRDSFGCYTLDFGIGDRDEYRVWDGEREHRAISRGSVSIAAHNDAEAHHPKHCHPFYLLIDEVSVHLPLYQEDEHRWQKFIDTQDRFALRERSGGMSTATHYPSPHIELAVDSCSLSEAKRIIREAANAYDQTEELLLANREDTRIGLDAGRASRE